MSAGQCRRRWLTSSPQNLHMKHQKLFSFIYSLSKFPCCFFNFQVKFMFQRNFSFQILVSTSILNTVFSTSSRYWASYPASFSHTSSASVILVIYCSSIFITICSFFSWCYCSFLSKCIVMLSLVYVMALSLL